MSFVGKRELRWNFRVTDRRQGVPRIFEDLFGRNHQTFHDGSKHNKCRQKPG
jgi:hypothetical protein